MTAQGGSVTIDFTANVTDTVVEDVRWFAQVVGEDVCMEITNATAIGGDLGDANLLLYSPDGLAVTVSNIFLPSAPGTVQIFLVVRARDTVFVYPAVVFINGGFGSGSGTSGSGSGTSGSGSGTSGSGSGASGSGSGTSGSGSGASGSGSGTSGSGSGTSGSGTSGSGSGTSGSGASGSGSGASGSGSGTSVSVSLQGPDSVILESADEVRALTYSCVVRMFDDTGRTIRWFTRLPDDTLEFFSSEVIPEVMNAETISNVTVNVSAVGPFGVLCSVSNDFGVTNVSTDLTVNGEYPELLAGTKLGNSTFVFIVSAAVKEIVVSVLTRPMSSLPLAPTKNACVLGWS